VAVFFFVGAHGIEEEDEDERGRPIHTFPTFPPLPKKGPTLMTLTPKLEICNPKFYITHHTRAAHRPILAHNYHRANKENPNPHFYRLGCKLEGVKNFPGPRGAR
jgi:hypothetical protein